MKAILAIDSKGGIGLNGTIPWHFHMDMLQFNAYTRNKICLTGKKTYTSIPEKNYTRLPTRRKIILSHNTTRDGFDRCQHWVPNWEEAGDRIEEYTRTPDRSDVIVIGGKSIYERLLPYCTEIVLTRIDRDYGCDTVLDEHLLDSVFGSEDCSGLYMKTKHVASVTEYPVYDTDPISYHIEKYARIDPLERDEIPDDLKPVVFPLWKPDGRPWD